VRESLVAGVERHQRGLLADHAEERRPRGDIGCEERERLAQRRGRVGAAALPEGRQRGIEVLFESVRR
jgi:hypothetical protein